MFADKQKLDSSLFKRDTQVAEGTRLRLALTVLKILYSAARDESCCGQVVLREIEPCPGSSDLLRRNRPRRRKRLLNHVENPHLCNKRYIAYKGQYSA